MKRFANVQKITIPVLTACMLIGNVSMALAESETMTIAVGTKAEEMVSAKGSEIHYVGTDEVVEDYVIDNTVSNTSNTPTDNKQFKDYNVDFGYGQLKGHWAEEQIQLLLSKGGIAGVPYGVDTYRFEANRSIKTNELLSIMLKLSNNLPKDMTNWSDSIMGRAIEMGLIPESMRAEGDVPLTREKMAMILVNGESKLRGKTIDVYFDSNRISDINTASAEYRDYIARAYGLGLLAGTGTGYNPKGITTRAETCAIVNRLFEYTSRVDNSTVVNQPDVIRGVPVYRYEVLPDGSNVGSVYGVAYPAEGLIGPDGKVITRDPETGVLGFGNGQHGGIWEGITLGGNHVITDGIKAPIDASDADVNARGEYETRGDYTFFTKEWAIIIGNSSDNLPKNAPIGTVADIYGNVTQGSKDDKNVFFYVDVDGLWTEKSLQSFKK